MQCVILVWRIFVKLPANFSANSSAMLFFVFGLVSQGFQGPPAKIHAQNSRPELSAFLSNFTLLNPMFSHADFLLTGENNVLWVQKKIPPNFPQDFPSKETKKINRRASARAGKKLSHGQQNRMCHWNPSLPSRCSFTKSGQYPSTYCCDLHLLSTSALGPQVDFNATKSEEHIIVCTKASVSVRPFVL